MLPSVGIGSSVQKIRQLAHGYDEFVFFFYTTVEKLVVMLSSKPFGKYCKSLLKCIKSLRKTGLRIASASSVFSSSGRQ